MGKTLKKHEIDNIICQELKKELNFDIENKKANVLEDKEIRLIYFEIEKKKEIIYSLFDGDFTINELNMKDQINRNFRKKPKDFYSKIANNILEKRVDKIFKEIVNNLEKTPLIISVVLDRYIFIKTLLEHNDDFKLPNREDNEK